MMNFWTQDHVPVYEGGEPTGYSISYIHKITTDNCAVVKSLEPTTPTGENIP